MRGCASAASSAVLAVVAVVVAVVVANVVTHVVLVAVALHVAVVEPGVAPQRKKPGPQAGSKKGVVSKYGGVSLTLSCVSPLHYH